MLNRYVKKTMHEGVEVLYNTVTKKSLSLNVSQEELKKHFFLEGQEQDAIHWFLSTPTNVISFVVNNTWECNLRCKHCSVLTQLVAKQKNKFNSGKFIAFANKFVKEYSKTKVAVSFVGGEALLDADTIIDICKHVGGRKSTTTNLAYELDDKKLQALSYMDHINISVDGLEEEHNQQRFPYKGEKINPFVITVENIKTLIKKGMRDKLHIQGAFKDALMNEEYIAKYLRFFYKLGIDSVTYGSIHTTDRLKEPDQVYLNSLKSPILYKRQCCAFRPGDVFYFDAEQKIWNSYWSWTRKVLGTFDDEPTTIVNNHIHSIIDTMPCLKDETCKQCPALGVCWGRCINGMSLHGDSPSKYCDQKRLINLLDESAELGTLIGKTTPKGD